MALLAQVSAVLVMAFDPLVAASGKVLWNTASGFGVSIEPGCNGVEACIILFAAIMAFPAGWRLVWLWLDRAFFAAVIVDGWLRREAQR